MKKNPDEPVFDTVVALDLNTAAELITDSVADNYTYIKDLDRWPDGLSHDRTRERVEDRGWLFAFKPIKLHTADSVEVEITEQDRDGIPTFEGQVCFQGDYEPIVDSDS